MGTRADFYLGRGPEAEWLGSIAWDGHPGSVVSRQPQPGYVSPPADEDDWRTEVAAFLAQRRDATMPEQGWPWPWEDSRTTDYAYAFDGGTLWASCFGYCWFVATEAEPEDDGPKSAVFPNMRSRQKVTYGRRSGVMVIGGDGPVDPVTIPSWSKEAWDNGAPWQGCEAAEMAGTDGDEPPIDGSDDPPPSGGDDPSIARSGAA